jgi:phosphoribosylformylglycinamidine (FGAM) synthase PurS component
MTASPTRQLDEMCRKLLANMVIENYRIERIAA